jgi:hypothetical protein
MIIRCGCGLFFINNIKSAMNSDHKVFIAIKLKKVLCFGDCARYVRWSVWVFTKKYFIAYLDHIQRTDCLILSRFSKFHMKADCPVLE